MTAHFIIEDDFEATRFANGLRALGIDIEPIQDGNYLIKP
jgi:hypothetical protein